MLLSLNHNELPDLTSLQRVTGDMGASRAWREWQVNLGRRRPHRADRTNVALPIER